MSRQSDHDRALERLLRAMPDEPAGITAACIDAERLAAWSEGGLSPAERESIDAHVASCGRCLAMLAVFSDTAAAAATHEGSVPHKGSVPAHEVGLTPRGTPILRPRFWRLPTSWAVPIGTAAAAVLIWMVLPAKPPAPAFAPTTQVARDEAASPTPAPQRFDDRSADQAREAGARQVPASPPPPPPALSKLGEPAAATERAEPGKPARPAPPVETLGNDQRRRQQEGAQESARIAEEPAGKAADTAATAAERAANEAAPDRMAAAAPPATLRRADAATVEILSPDPASRWRLRASVVERSTTRGSSWQPATVPAGAIVTTGSSPASNVCWLIGPAGTVLRTTDGSRFDAVSIPGAGSLVSIQATDASRATATSADGTTYRTTDGGRNWTR